MGDEMLSALYQAQLAIAVVIKVVKEQLGCMMLIVI